MGVQYNTSIVTSGLQVYYDAANVKSYPGSGSTWYDLSGNSNHATLYGSTIPTWSSNGYFTFNGTDQYARSTLSYNDYTHLIFFYPSEGSREQHLVEFSSQQFYFSAGNKLHTASWGTAGSTTSISLNQWSCGGITRSGTSIQLYFNGKADGSSGTGTTNSGAILYIARLYTTGNYYFNGRISVVQSYNRVLSAAEIKQNFNAMRGRYGI